MKRLRAFILILVFVSGAVLSAPNARAMVIFSVSKKSFSTVSSKTFAVRILWILVSVNVVRLWWSGTNHEFARPAGLLGETFLLLNDSSQVVSFEHADEHAAERLGLTPDEQQSYNAYRARLNSSLDIVHAESVAYEKYPERLAVAKMHLAWLKATNAYQVPPAALAAARKIGFAAVAELKAAGLIGAELVD